MQSVAASATEHLTGRAGPSRRRGLRQLRRLRTPAVRRLDACLPPAPRLRPPSLKRRLRSAPGLLRRLPRLPRPAPRLPAPAAPLSRTARAGLGSAAGSPRSMGADRAGAAPPPSRRPRKTALRSPRWPAPTGPVAPPPARPGARFTSAWPAGPNSAVTSADLPVPAPSCRVAPDGTGTPTVRKSGPRPEARDAGRDQGYADRAAGPDGTPDRGRRDRELPALERRSSANPPGDLPRPDRGPSRRVRRAASPTVTARSGWSSVTARRAGPSPPGRPNPGRSWARRRLSPRRRAAAPGCRWPTSARWTSPIGEDAFAITSQASASASATGGSVGGGGGASDGGGRRHHHHVLGA